MIHSIKTQMKSVKSALMRSLNEIAPVACFLNRAPSNEPFPYAVVCRMSITTLDEGHLATFDLEIHTDETLEDSAETLEDLCDTFRSRVEQMIITDGQTFSAHANYESEREAGEAEFDLMHRTLSFTLRIFHYEQIGMIGRKS